MTPRPLRTNIIAASQAMGGNLRRAKKASIHVKTHIQNRPIFCHPYFSKYPPDPRAVLDGTCTGHLRGVVVLVRVLHVLSKYRTIAIDIGPSMVELVLDISESPRCWFLYYTSLKSVEHNDKRHSVPGRISKEL